MKFKYLFFALLTVASASSFTGCNESTPEPTSPETCETCENETVVDSLFNQEAIVKKHYFNYEKTIYTYVLSIRKQDIASSNNTHGATTDSTFYPCPALSKEYQKIDMKVRITGYKKSCTGKLTNYAVFGFWGSKFDLISINKK